MSATDELRAELTKRGVEWKAPSSYDGSNRYDTVAGGYWFHEFDGKITIHGLTPAQAIAATLGSGTCVPILNSERDCQPYLSLWFVCSECGCQLTENRLGKVWQKFCPNCGRKVMDE